MRFLSAILLASLAAGALADGIYKWEDEHGVVHFGSQPPQKEKVEVVKEPRSERYKQWKKEQLAAETRENQKNKAAEDRSSLTETGKRQTAGGPGDKQQAALTQAQKAVRAQRCSQARSNLQELTTHSQVREVNASGKVRVLPEEERQARIRRAREIIQRDC